MGEEYTLKKVYKNEWSDKGGIHTYIDYYSKIFDIYKKKEIRLLEIGVFQGGSLKLWETYFKKGIIYGIDTWSALKKRGINSPKFLNVIDMNIGKGHPIINESNIVIYTIDGTKEEEVNSVFRNSVFDIVIDDGSHKIEDQISSFNIFYPKLKEGGIYIIEDVVEDSIKKLKQLNDKLEIVDLRNIRNVFDNILAVVK